MFNCQKSGDNGNCVWRASPLASLHASILASGTPIDGSPTSPGLDTFHPGQKPSVLTPALRALESVLPEALLPANDGGRRGLELSPDRVEGGAFCQHEDQPSPPLFEAAMDRPVTRLLCANGVGDFRSGTRVCNGKVFRIVNDKELSVADVTSKEQGWPRLWRSAFHCDADVPRSQREPKKTLPR